MDSSNDLPGSGDPESTEGEVVASAAPDPVLRTAGRPSKWNRSRWRRALLAFAALLAIDLLALPPAYQPSSRLILLAIDAYQATLSKAMPSMGVQCRFTPTCSHYSEAAIDRKGTLHGGGLAAWRILRCGPWTPPGTLDPPPENPRGAASQARPPAAPAGPAPEP